MRTSPQGPGQLLERGRELALLAELRDGLAATGSGHLVLIGGESGIGKTSLVRSVLAETDIRCLSGGCDALFTPRPLGPILDIAEMAGGDLEEVIEAGATPHEVARALMRELRDQRATIIVLEDLHWADEATLDVFGILAGRIASLPALVLATYRDDELAGDHPLRLVLGGLATRAAITRLTLAPLSAEAVTALAAPSSVDPVELHRTTGGNPFYVTEVLAGAVAEIPPTVRDAVHARVTRLSAQARELLDAAAILPPPVELELLETVAGETIRGLEECLAAGLLTEQAGRLAFRHELARIAIEEGLPPNRRVALHRAALAAHVADPAPDLARVAHHAEAAGDGAAVLRFAPAAAARAVSMSAHRQAAAQYERTLRFADELPPSERGDLIDAWALECRAIGEFRQATELIREAAHEHARAGDPRKHAASLCQLALMSFVLAESAAEAQEVLHEAIAALEREPDAPELLVAFRVLSALCLTQHDRDGVFEWTGRARELAERLRLPVPLYVQLHRTGIDYPRGVEAARTPLEECVAHAVETHDYDGAGIGYGQLATGAARNRRHDLAETYIRAGRDYSVEHDLDGYTPYFDAWQAVVDLQRGRWAQAEEAAQLVLGLGGTGPATALTLITVA
ncbi:MAG: hypothetical protein QOI11_1878, partial [Candidatus Eremiobacteraeota bacterium]|nr:hypothetical protein [Candidatus Eremiobacteraeota bacterium]